MVLNENFSVKINSTTRSRGLKVLDRRYCTMPVEFYSRFLTNVAKMLSWFL